MTQTKDRFTYPRPEPAMYRLTGMAKHDFINARGEKARARTPQSKERPWDEPKPVLKPRSAHHAEQVQLTHKELLNRERQRRHLDATRPLTSPVQARTDFERQRGRADATMSKAQDQIRASSTDRKAAFKQERASPYVRQAFERTR